MFSALFSYMSSGGLMAVGQFVSIHSRKEEYEMRNSIIKIINSVTASLRQNKGSVGDHKAVFVDVQNQRALVYDIKKETSGEVSASGRGLDEYNPRSRTVYLNDTLIPRIVNAGEIDKIEFNAYASAHDTQRLHSPSNQWQTMDTDK